MNIKSLWHWLCRHRSRTGFLLLLTGAAFALANEFLMPAGVPSIAGIGGEPSVVGLTLVICGMALVRRAKSHCRE